MCKRIALLIMTVSLFALSLSAMAASTGELLPGTASEVEVYAWDGANWSALGSIGNSYVPARSWNSLSADGGGWSNKPNHTIDFTHHASVAQWINWTLSGTRKDWRIRQPGTYASDSLTFTIKSNNDVNVDFEEFDDLLYENPTAAPGDTQTTIPTWYSYGATVFNANANGWISAADLNNEDFTFINTDPLHHGFQYKLWAKIEVEESNNSSDYENVGVITISLTNIKHWIDPATGRFAAVQN